MRQLNLYPPDVNLSRRLFFPYIVTIMFEVRRFFISNENFRNFQHVSVKFSHPQVIVHNYNSDNIEEKT